MILLVLPWERLSPYSRSYLGLPLTALPLLLLTLWKFVIMRDEEKIAVDHPLGKAL